MSQWKPWSPLVLRAVLGPIFIYAGWSKLMDAWGWMVHDQAFGFAGMVDFMPILPAELWALAAMAAELIGGLFILLGFNVRFAAILLSTVMLVAIIGVRMPDFHAARLEFALLAMSISIFLSGPGKISLRIE